MLTRTVLTLFAIILCCHGLPQKQPALRNTIFGDERLKGEIFEDLIEEVSPLNDDLLYRLPTTTRPIHYDVLWAIDIERLAFEGQVDITLHATQTGVTQIYLHADEIDILEVVLRDSANAVVLSTYSQEEEYDFLIVTVSTPLAYNAATPIEYRLTIRFGAPLRFDMYGIYRSWYVDNPGEDEKWMATTQFQATSARQAFPCYDEPLFKATFDITIRRPKNYSSWSCTSIRTTDTTSTTYDADIYHTTPIMSTYLLALIVADYDSQSTVDNKYEVIARPSVINEGQGDYAFNVGQLLLAEMSNHTGIDFYSTNDNIKMTQAAIPDFSAGAMENWGLLTYREAYLLYNENNTNSNSKQLIAYILSHEIAHMWFGNLVTCDWWGVLWLNEGFARYYQYFLTDWVEVDMGFETRFIVEQVHTALLSDSANFPHPLTNPRVGSPASVNGMFSVVTYNKGAAVIRMTEHLLGFEVHREGLRNYLRNKEFGTALPIDLFQALEEVGRSTGSLDVYGPDFSLVDYYRSWTEVAGHPVLNVQVNHQTGQMIVYQRRFNINTGYSPINNANYIVPVSFATASDTDFENTKPTHILTNAVTVIDRGTIGDEWVIFNKQQTGFYRVNYDAYTWNLIILALNSDQRTLIHEYNRAQIVNDVFQFARSGLMPYNRAFNILSFLRHETSYAPWVAATVGFSWLRGRFAGTPQNTQLESMIENWAQTVMANVTYYPGAGEPDSDFMRSYLRYQIAPVMCSIGVRACRDAAVEQFQRQMNNNELVPVDSRNWVYCNALREGGETEFNYLWNRFNTINIYSEKILILQTIGCTPHAASLNSFLEAIVRDTRVVRPQDYTTAWNSAVAGNEGNTQIVFEFIKANLELVDIAFNGTALPISYVSSRLRSVAQIEEFEQWVEESREQLGDQYNGVLSGAASTRAALQWTASVADDVSDYLVNGDENIQMTTPSGSSEPEPQLIEEPELELPELQEPSSAMKSFLSIGLLAGTVIVNFMF